jgi:hypothetical protein
MVDVYGLRYSTTVEELKLKLFTICRLRPSKTVIEKDGFILSKESAPLLYYGIGQGAILNAAEPTASSEGRPDKVRVFVRPSIG